MRIVILMAAAAFLLFLNGSGVVVSFFKMEPLPRSAEVPTFKPVAPGLAPGALTRRQGWDAQRQQLATQSETDASLNALRRETMLAVNAFNSVPCAPNAKANAIARLTDYFRTVKARYKCDTLFCDDGSAFTVFEEQHLFGTALDKQVQLAFVRALRDDALGPGDFPFGSVVNMDMPSFEGKLVCK